MKHEGFSVQEECCISSSDQKSEWLLFFMQTLEEALKLGIERESKSCQRALQLEKTKSLYILCLQQMSPVID